MNITELQKEIQKLIKEYFANHSYQTASECLNIYERTFGCDDFYTDCELLLLSEDGPSISLICFQNDADSVKHFIDQQNYKNLDVFFASSANWEYDIRNYISSANSKYICFFEPNHKYAPSKLSMMVFMAKHHPKSDGILCTRNFIDENNTIIAHPDRYQNVLNDKILAGSQIIEKSISNNINLYGNFSTLLLTTQHVKQMQFDLSEVPSSMHKLAFLHQLLFKAELYCMNLPLVSTILMPYENPAKLEKDYKNYLQILQSKGKINISDANSTTKACQHHNTPVSKNITFFHTDKGEYYNLKPIADEAEKRGYKISFTENIYQKAEIGVYCQHVCFPENSKFSIILLHDLAQGHNRWPNMWELEPWNKFDIGILPGKSWAERWSQSACQYYVNPRCGVFNFGYPKSDVIRSEALKNHANKLRQQLNLKYDISILYAPSWENDGKEHDFVTSLSSLNVNLLIKQAHLPEGMAPIIENIRQMRALHEGKYPNVYYIEPEESIQTALALCDYVVSDESSVMSEAVMFGKLSVAVTDWLIPDTMPSRNAYFPMDYVLKCQKSQLQETVKDLIQSPEIYMDILDKGMRSLSSPDNVCKNIMDAIEYYTTPEAERDPSTFCHEKLTSKYTPCSMWN